MERKFQCPKENFFARNQPTRPRASGAGLIPSYDAENAEIGTETVHQPRYQREVIIGVFQSDEIWTTCGEGLKRFDGDRHRSAPRYMIDEKRQPCSPRQVREEC
jgi:hypothetical protein